MISGPAGAGRSRLAREALDAAARDGARVEWVQATRSATSIPLGAFASVIPPDVRCEHRFELMRASAQALRERDGGQPTVIAIDDAQWLDHTSAALALHLANAGAAFILATVSSGESCPDAIVSLWKDAGAPRLEVSLLTASEVVELTEAVLGGRIERTVRDWITEVSGGNPMYVRELIVGALESERLRVQDGLWRMVSRPPVNSSLSEIVAARLSGMADAEQRTIQLLALGEPLRLSEMVALVGADPLAVLQERGLLVADDLAPDSGVRLAEPLYGEVVRMKLPSLRARELWIELAEVVQARPEHDPEDMVRVARWLTAAGQSVPLEILLRAARDAIYAADTEFAARLAARAIDDGGGTRAALLLARSLAIESRFEEAEKVLTEFEAQIESREQALQYLEQQSEVLHWGLGRADELCALLDRATAWWDDDQWRESLEPLRYLARQVDEIRSRRHRYGDPPPPDGVYRNDAGQLEGARVGALLYTGRLREAYRLASRIHPELPLGSMTQLASLTMWARVILEHGEGWAELEHWMRSALDTGIRGNHHATAGLAAYTLAYLRTLAGRFADARVLLAEAEAEFERRDPLGMSCVAQAQLCVVQAASGSSDLAAVALTRCLQQLDGHEPLVHQLPYVVRARAWTAYAHGELTRAQELLLEGTQRLWANPVQAASIAYDSLRAGAEPRQLSMVLTRLRERCNGRLAAAYARHARALADNHGPALLQVADEMERIGALRYATEAAADAARAFLSEGREDSARRAAARSRALFVEGQGASMPVVDGLNGPAAELTARETELVGLAARGLSNAEIAECLVLSVRTVESHLYRAMRKLGISDRRDLQLCPAPGVGSPLILQ